MSATDKIKNVAQDMKVENVAHPHGRGVLNDNLSLINQQPIVCRIAIEAQGKWTQ